MTHEDWRVRRASAESLGRLAPDGAGSAIVAAFAKETDNHAKADQLHALARLGSDKFEAFHDQLMTAEDPFLHGGSWSGQTAFAAAITSKVLSEEAYAKAIATVHRSCFEKFFRIGRS